MRRGISLAALILGLALVACFAVGIQADRNAGAAEDASGGTVAGMAQRAHPQAIQPAAGVAATVDASDPEMATPVGDPSASAKSLAQIKSELKILNLCGGATSNTLAQPLGAAAGPGFMADPGTVQNVGVLPVLTARLDALAKALGVTIYGISGYRTPAHSVAVGGFADDPHTKGEAEDIGVNSLVRSSAAQISEAQLARYGLYRPFDPSDDPSNTEVNHIQLIPAGGPLSLAQATSAWSPDPRCR